MLSNTSLFLNLVVSSLLISSISHADFVEASHEQKLNNCARLEAVNNRCEVHMHFNREQNSIDLPGLGKSIPCDDRQVMPFLVRLKNPDVGSMLSQKYPAGDVPLPITEKDLSPGGLRNMDLNKAVYGMSESAVTSNLTTVDFLGQKILFNKMNGAAFQLSQVSNDLLTMYHLGTDQKLISFLKPFIEKSSTPCERCDLRNFSFEWRVVKGTQTLSNHSFAVALDMEPPSGPEYWLWEVATQVHEGKAILKPGADPKNLDYHDVLNYKPQANPVYPLSMVSVFEKHGFIWGGKWYRFDIMHFEFRPDLFEGTMLDCK